VASHCKNDGVIFTPFRSNDHSDTCVLLSFKICEGSLVCVRLPFLAKCSFRSDSIVLSFMSNYFNLLSMHACQTQLIIKGWEEEHVTSLGKQAES